MLVLVSLCLHPFLFYLRLSGWSQKLSILGINRRMPKEPKLYAKDLAARVAKVAMCNLNAKLVIQTSYFTYLITI